MIVDPEGVAPISRWLSAAWHLCRGALAPFFLPTGGVAALHHRLIAETSPRSPDAWRFWEGMVQAWLTPSGHEKGGIDFIRPAELEEIGWVCATKAIKTATRKTGFLNQAPGQDCPFFNRGLYTRQFGSTPMRWRKAMVIIKLRRWRALPNLMLPLAVSQLNPEKDPLAIKVHLSYQRGAGAGRFLMYLSAHSNISARTCRTDSRAR
jgi:hypothetical protein